MVLLDKKMIVSVLCVGQQVLSVMMGLRLTVMTTALFYEKSWDVLAAGYCH